MVENESHKNVSIENESGIAGTYSASYSASTSIYSDTNNELITNTELMCYLQMMTHTHTNTQVRTPLACIMYVNHWLCIQLFTAISDPDSACTLDKNAHAGFRKASGLHRKTTDCTAARLPRTTLTPQSTCGIHSDVMSHDREMQTAC